MARRKQYTTKQSKELLDYLQSARDRQMTASEICRHFEQTGTSVGIATVYRNLERLVEAGVVAKYVVDGTNGACFAYIGESGDSSRPPRFHCKCTKCGSLTPLECDLLEGLGEHMLAHHGFEMDSRYTVFYGVCNQCRE